MNTIESKLNFLEMEELDAPPCDKSLQWAVQFWQTVYAGRAYKASLAYHKYDQAIDDEKSHAEIECLWQMYEILDVAARDAGRVLDEAKAALLARVN
jgi:hypothetical protein